MREQKAFRKVMERFRGAPPDARRQMLTAMYAPAFRDRGVTHAIRLNRKYRILVGRADDTYVVEGVVSRGDSRFYRSE
jgi:hypothetical protein